MKEVLEEKLKVKDSWIEELEWEQYWMWEYINEKMLNEA